MSAPISKEPQSGLVHTKPMFSSYTHTSSCASLKNLTGLCQTVGREIKRKKRPECNVLYWNSLKHCRNTVLSPGQAARSPFCLCPVNTSRKKKNPLMDENVDSSFLSWMGEEQRWGALQQETDGFLICACLWMNVCEWMWAYRFAYVNYCYRNKYLDSIWSKPANKSGIRNNPTKKN